ncbi:hypothetical protein FVEG_15358 [Fusarium verticillioides 7600]|uniref:Uncharacterized protein n=1 Tax=Gibberella moniliformis (strain M3125 / FGSC 7600) TaxID=334819 RepID=W7M2X7_GIBM7|nr:hypothetical protein FVEG_15358 [Fusarium verticillioides 7600]EWG41910.1 hypothetical protein FVEG_15358 [Fusarium verticillioides 7600]RBQ94610.1 hypothetical protein FVER53263_20052 [Fusarium verticillioides]
MQQHLDLLLDDSFVVVEESVWFLDIVAIALKKTYHPVAHDAYNGRLETVQRQLTIRKVAQATPLHKLLASRGTGGQGLNMQFTNIIIDADPGGRKSGRSKQLNELTDQDNRSLPLFANWEPRTVL